MVKKVKEPRRKLQQAHSVYNLPSKEEAVKWMHAFCGYPVKSTWIKSNKAGKYVGWKMLTKRNVYRYYPETSKTPKGHMDKSRKNVRYTKPKRTPLEVPKTLALQGHKARDVYTRVYKVSNTVFSDQIGQLPTRSQQGNKYIMVMVEIDSNAILVEPIKNRNNEELTRAYISMMVKLRQAVIISKKHILYNEVSKAPKTIIQDE